MKKTNKQKGNINTLSDFESYRKELKTDYNLLAIGIRNDIKVKLNTFPYGMISNKQSHKDNLSEGIADSAANGTALIVKKILPKKTGFLKKWLITLIARKVVKNVVNKSLLPIASTSVKVLPNSTSFVALPIATNPNIINNPNDDIQNNLNKKIADMATKKEKLSFKGIWAVIKDSFTGFSDHKVTKISGSLAYYTIFSMAPLLVMVIALCGIFLEKDAAQGHIFLQLKGFLGPDTAQQLQELIQKAAIGDKGIVASIIGGVTLLVGATSIFADIQDSINGIWGIKPKPKRGWLKMLQNRFLSFSVIISLGFLLLVSLGVSAVLDGLNNRLKARFDDISVVVFNGLNIAVTFIVVSLIFGVIFKVLPDAKIRWKDVTAGAMVTAVLFMLGKLGISFYIGQSDVGSTYGAAGSLVVLLLWAYYSSIILYMGAEFTKAYALRFGEEIHPASYAVTTKEVEVEQGNAPVQDNQKETVKK